MNEGKGSDEEPPESRAGPSGQSPAGPRGETVSIMEQLAHDLRSPISALVVLAEGLRDDLDHELEPVHRRRLDLLYGAAVSVEHLLHDLVQLSRDDEELQLSRSEPFSLEALLRETCDAVAPLAEVQGRGVTCRHGEPDRRKGPRAALKWILLALARTPLKERVEGDLELFAVPKSNDREQDSKGGHQVELGVAGPGPGPDPEVVEEVAEVAAGLRDRTRACYSNSGLELAFRMVRLIGCELSVTREPGPGIRYSFILSLPPASADGPSVR